VEAEVVKVRVAVLLVVKIWNRQDAIGMQMMIGLADTVWSLMFPTKGEDRPSGENAAGAGVGRERERGTERKIGDVDEQSRRLYAKEPE
jgi:hypothetical protein